VLAKVPAGMQAEIKDAYWKIFDTEDLKTQPGPRLVELVDHRITEMAERYSATYPSAMKCLLADREGLTAYLRFPAEHHHRVRHSNFIERTFGETRRRTKVIGRLPGETSCLTLASLPPLQADVVMLRVVAGLDTGAVARLVGRSPGAVRVAVHRGLRRLARLMTEAGVTR
jgi:transposase-like protein